MRDLTVLDKGNDPFRLDTPAHHRDGQWFRDRVNDLYGSGAHFHLRGLHYRIVARGDIAMPNGEPYINTHKCWLWLVA
jgi:hypothetical protein